MIRFIMAVGLPGSGKSTVYQNSFSDCEYVSSDAIREEVFGDVNDQSHNAEVFEIMMKRTREYLKNGRDVFYDATNLSTKRRIGFLKEISHFENVVKFCALVVPPIEIVKEQNAKRDRKVPEYVINRMFKSFDMPHKSEGWDDIIIFNNKENYALLSKMIYDACSIPHDNPHHSASIGNHMRLANDYMKKIVLNNGLKYSADEMLYLGAASMAHDIGKPYCKVWHNAKGEPSEVAHYYNHENVGTYIFISHSMGKEDDIYAANLIAHHMDYWKGEKYIEKIRSRFGEKFMKDLDLLHEADLAAH